MTTTYPPRFKRLRDDSWGVAVYEDGDLTGSTVEVRKRDESVASIVLGERVARYRDDRHPALYRKGSEVQAQTSLLPEDRAEAEANVDRCSYCGEPKDPKCKCDWKAEHAVREAEQEREAYRVKMERDARMATSTLDRTAGYSLTALAAKIEGRTPIAGGAFHKAEVAEQFANDAESVCVHCHSTIKRVPGGNGTIWVHADGVVGSIATSGHPIDADVARIRPVLENALNAGIAEGIISDAEAVDLNRVFRALVNGYER